MLDGILAEESSTPVVVESAVTWSVYDAILFVKPIKYVVVGVAMIFEKMVAELPDSSEDKVFLRTERGLTFDPGKSNSIL
jgi:hypothetical protein